MTRQNRTAVKGGLWLILALVALVFKVATPPGFMVASTATGPALVICTGHGPAILDSASRNPGQPAKSPGKSGDGSCPFAAAVASAPPPAIVAFVVWRAPITVAAATGEVDQSPGRGLAAPPPPSQGPPLSRV